MPSIKQTVARLIRQHGTNDPYEIASQRRILVHFFPLKDVWGHLQSYKRIFVICIHQGLNDQQKRFVCAHELGHAILHPGVNTPFLRKHTMVSLGRIEREANEFAIELLMPDDSVNQHHSPDRPFTLKEAAATYGVPEEMVALKRFRQR